MRILVDMDGVIADFEGGFLDRFRQCHPDLPYIPLNQRNCFYVKEQYPEDIGPLLEEIYLSKGFYLELPPIEGSVEALTELSKKDYDVYICTSPLLKNPYCLQEKYDWIINHLGEDWAKRMVIAKDKTIIQGDILIDDKPDIKGIQKPTWEHIIYSQPYNEQITSKRRITWNDWRTIIRA
jgi:5'-nucleotidase